MNRADRRALSRDIAKQIAAGGVDLAPPAAPPATIFLGWLYRDPDAKPTGGWVQSLLASAARSGSLGYGLVPRACETGPQLDKARNLLLRSFLETDLNYLLFSDTDVIFAPEDIAKLLEANAPITGALYFTAVAGVEPWPVALVGPNEEGAYTPWDPPEPPDDLVPGTDDPEVLEKDRERMAAFVEEALKPVTVAAVGMGLTLIRRDAAEAIAEAHERPFEYADGRSEDLTFCLRAAELGFETVLVPAARVGHVKAVVL